MGAPNGFTLKQLFSEGYESIFVGIGLPDPKLDPVFKGLGPENGFYNSKNFLPDVAMASKPGVTCVCMYVCVCVCVCVCAHIQVVFCLKPAYVLSLYYVRS